MREIDKIAHKHFAIVAELVGALVADAHSAFAMRQERKLGNRRHKFDRGRMQGIACDDRQRIGLENLQLTLWLDLAAVAKFARHHMTVVSMIGQLKATPEIDHVDQVLDGILWPDQPHVDQELAAIDVIAGHAPAHVEQRRPGSHAAGAIAAFFGAHPPFDLPQQGRVAVVSVEEREQHVGEGEQLGFLRRSGYAEPANLVRQHLQGVVRLQQLPVGDGLRGHRGDSSTSFHTSAGFSTPV